jgi:crotonobetainyl-CoA hydratase
MNEFLKVTRNGQILEIVLDRPKANAIDGPLSRAMGELFAGFRDDPDLRVAIFTGAGEKFFSGGWDLNAAAGDEGYLDDFGEGGFGGFPKMKGLLKPVICAVNGLTIGGGLEMLLRADLIVAAEHAEFLLPEARIGMAPDVATFMLPKIMPRQKAFEILMTGRRFSAQELADIGIINDVVPASELMDRARALAEELLQAAPLSLEAIKEAVELTENMSFDQCFESLHTRSWPAFMKMLQSHDAKEGPRAFVEKRKPVWKGE